MSSAVYRLSRSSVLTLIFLSRYFGRAKELPGVKELFASNGEPLRSLELALNLTKSPIHTAAESAEAETYKHQRHDAFSNQGPAYYGDEDEKDGDLFKYEQEAEAEGAF